MWAARCSASINPTPKNCVKRSIPDTVNRTNNGAGAGAVSRDDAAALAVAGGNPKRCPRRSESATVRSNLALLARINPSHRGDLFFRRTSETTVAAGPWTWLRRWPDVFLDQFFLADNSHRARLVRFAILYGDLLRPVGRILWFDATARNVGNRHC